MVVGKVLHSQGVFTQCLFILAVLSPDLVKVTHFMGGKEVKWLLNQHYNDHFEEFCCLVRYNQALLFISTGIGQHKSRTVSKIPPLPVHFVRKNILLPHLSDFYSL